MNIPSLQFKLTTCIIWEVNINPDQPLYRIESLLYQLLSIPQYFPNTAISGVLNTLQLSALSGSPNGFNVANLIV